MSNTPSQSVPERCWRSLTAAGNTPATVAATTIATTTSTARTTATARTFYGSESPWSTTVCNAGPTGQARRAARSARRDRFQQTTTGNRWRNATESKSNARHDHGRSPASGTRPAPPTTATANATAATFSSIARSSPAANASHSRTTCPSELARARWWAGSKTGRSSTDDATDAETEPRHDRCEAGRIGSFNHIARA